VVKIIVIPMELSSPESRTARRRQRDIFLYGEEADDDTNDAMYIMKSIWYYFVIIYP
jgi:hypothetical protein